jgi:heme exporter protein B
MGTKSSTWIEQALSIFQKDIKSELRTRYALNAIVMFAVVTLAVVGFSVGQFSLSPKVSSSLFWVVIFFSSMSGLAQVFIKEEEAKTVNLLKLVASPSNIFLGKFFFNWALLLFLEIIIVPLFILLLGLNLENFWLFICVLVLGSLGLVCATTIIAAMVSKAHIKGALFAVLSFPILLPLLIVCIDGTYLSIQGKSFSEGASDLKVLVSFSVVMLILSLLLFDLVWKE